MKKNNLLWEALKSHIGHEVSIVAYGDTENPADICLECEDCGEVILDAELYTLCAVDETEAREEMNEDLFPTSPTSEEISRLKEDYPAGTRIRLLKMDDSYTKIPLGTLGTVTGVDDTGTIHCHWDTGSSLGVVYAEDKCEKVSIAEDTILKDFRNGNETGFGEPQAWISCENGRSIEVCLEMEGLVPWEYYYSIRLHCSEEELESEYKHTEGVIQVETTKDAHLKDAILIAEEMWNNNKIIENGGTQDE